MKLKGAHKTVLIIILLVACVYLYVQYEKVSNEFEEVQKTELENLEIATEVVKSLYHFSSIEELDDNMDKLKDLVSEEVYEELTIDNTERTLSVYLKFNNKPSKVTFDEMGNSHLIYRLDTESISSFRKFAFFYEVEDGKVVRFREAEILDFK